MQDTLHLLLSLLGLGQVVTGAISWYFGLQVKMLRLELVNKEVCHARHEKLEREMADLRMHLAHVDSECGERHA